MTPGGPGRILSWRRFGRVLSACSAVTGRSLRQRRRDLGARCAESHRRYHGIVHVRAVVRDVAVLAAELRLPAEERAVLVIAAGAHDVVYDGRPGDDERRSASWARYWLAQAGVGKAHVAKAGELVLATAAHSASPDDLAAWVLLDADLAILGADPAVYDRYRLAVREEYAALGESAWRAGRAAVMSGLLARDPLYGTRAARRRWKPRPGPTSPANWMRSQAPHHHADAGGLTAAHIE
jgi:predicted metal-dependent HD superfamily phosphohydrolase